jgi:hypothetical protein
MPPVNDILPFCPTDTGTNLLSQGDYAVAPDLAIGNQPGVASSKLVNKVLRQSSFIASQLAQMLANQLGLNVNDDANAPKLLGQMNAAFNILPPVYSQYIGGGSTGTHYRTFVFMIASGNATIGATYTVGGFTFTVQGTIAAGIQLTCKGTGVPPLSGTLTKASGTGDATITFFAFRQAVALRARVIGGGAGGGSGGTYNPSGNGSSGTDTTFGPLTAQGGFFGQASCAGGGGPGGIPTALSGGFVGIAVQGGAGNGSMNSASGAGGGGGGNSLLGGGGAGSTPGTPGGTAAPNSGAGGGGGSGTASGSGGGSGGGYDVFNFTSIAASYAYAIGTGGTVGTTLPSGTGAGPGADGIIEVWEMFQ